MGGRRKRSRDRIKPTQTRSSSASSLSSLSETDSPNSRKMKETKKQSTSIAYGHGPGLVDAKLADFIDQLQNIDASAYSIIQSTADPRTKSCLEMLMALTKTAGFLLKHIPSNLQTISNELQKLPSIISDGVEDEKRQRSIVISNLPESEFSSPTGRARADNQAVCELLDVLKCECLPTETFRMGKIQGQRSRLLKVVLPSRSAARDALANRGNLKLLTQYQHIQIRESLKPDQLRERAEMIKDRIQRNSALSPEEKESLKPLDCLRR